jgi:NTP pyrophosphatase (non-canonical NTP hydrolase)
MRKRLRSSEKRIDIFDLHQKMTSHLFPSYSNTDERFLALGLCGEAGELANMIKKRWRDGVDLTEEIRDEIADIRVYLELIAKCFDIEGSKLDDRVQQKLEKVVVKFGARLNGDNYQGDDRFIK